MQIFEEESFKSRMGNVKVDTSVQWQKQKNKQVFSSSPADYW